MWNGKLDEPHEYTENERESERKREIDRVADMDVELPSTNWGIKTVEQFKGRKRTPVSWAKHKLRMRQVRAKLQAVITEMAQIFHSILEAIEAAS